MKNRKRSRSQIKRSAPLPRIQEHAGPAIKSYENQDRPEPQADEPRHHLLKPPGDRPPGPPKIDLLIPEKPPSEDSAQLARMEALTKIARSTWFTLLAALFFFGLTLMGFRHIDYFDVTRSIKLPFVDVPVATRLFFIFAPALTAAVYCYFHLYLIRLWDAIAEADATTEEMPLGRRIAPWLLTDAALYLRDRLGGGDRRIVHGDDEAVEGGTALANFLFAWGFGIFVLFGAAIAVLPLQNILLTIATLGPLVIACSFGAASLLRLLRVIDASATDQKRAKVWIRRVSLLRFAIIVSAIVYFGAQFLPNIPRPFKTPLDFAGQEIVSRPEGWQDYAAARTVFRSQWCAREEIADCSSLSSELASKVESEWLESRFRTLSKLPPPVIPRGLDLSGANLERVFWPMANLRVVNAGGANLAGAQLEGANLSGARLEGADLSGARMERTNLTEARLEGADLSEARLEGADLSEARLMGADLAEARLEGADLSGAWMERADLTEARLKGVDLRGARIGGADLTEARLEGADLTAARMESADLTEAWMEGADLSGAWMESADLTEARLKGADLTEARLEGADLTEARLEGADLTGAWMERANFNAADLKSAALTETFTDTSVRAADLRSDDVTQRILNNVFGDISTIIPDGLVMPDHWDDQTLENYWDEDPKFEAWLTERKAAK